MYICIQKSIQWKIFKVSDDAKNAVLKMERERVERERVESTEGSRFGMIWLSLTFVLNIVG